MKDEYKLDGSTQLDSNKIAEKSLYVDQRGQVPNAWDIHMYYYVANGDTLISKDILRTGDTSEFLQKLSDMWFDNARNEARTQKSCGAGTFRCCTNCHLVGADIDGLCHRPQCRRDPDDELVSVGQMSIFALDQT